LKVFGSGLAADDVDLLRFDACGGSDFGCDFVSGLAAVDVDLLRFDACGISDFDCGCCIGWGCGVCG
jgi:hypothetical protein